MTTEWNSVSHMLFLLVNSWAPYELFVIDSIGVIVFSTHENAKSVRVNFLIASRIIAITGTFSDLMCFMGNLMGHIIKAGEFLS